MVKIIDGKKIAEKIKSEIVKEMLRLNIKIGLTIVLVGKRKDSMLYVNLKEREARKIGIDAHVFAFENDTTEEQILNIIDFLNKDDLVNAIIVQFPLPKKMNVNKIVKSINPKKDVDSFHPENLKNMFEENSLKPPVFDSILEILDSINCKIAGKKVCVLANSQVFGKNLVKIMEWKGADAKMVKQKSLNIKLETREADILITAIGKPNFVKKNMVKKGAIVIDVGITKVKDKIYGDVDFKNVKDKVKCITPVPGGVGPVTVATALRNALILRKNDR